MKLLAANRKKNQAKKTGGAGPLQLLGSPHHGRSGRGHFFRPWWQQLGNPGICMFQVIYVTMFIQQLFMNIVGVKSIYVFCSDREYSGVAATTHCHSTVPYRGNSETNSQLNIYKICNLFSQVEVLDDQETVSACSLREHFRATLLRVFFTTCNTHCESVLTYGCD